MFSLLLRHSGSVNELYHTFRTLCSPSIKKRWEKAYVLVDTAFQHHTEKILPARKEDVVVKPVPKKEWPHALNTFLTAINEPWVCTCDTTCGRDALSGLPDLVQAVQTFPDSVGFRLEGRPGSRGPHLFCWNRAFMIKRGGWPLRSEWPFTDEADRYVWAALPESNKTSIVVNKRPVTPNRSFWYKQKERWVDYFLTFLENRRAINVTGGGKDPLVSVIISAYNEEAHIPWSIASVLYQTMPHFELIIVNDGSTDETVKVIQRYNDPRIKLVSHSTNRGKVHCLNEALAMARGSILFELDADDWLGPEALDWAVTEMKKQQKDVAFLYGDRLFWNEDSYGQLTVRHEQRGKQVWSRRQYMRDLTPIGPRVYRREALDAVGGWPVDAFCDGRLYEDVRIVLHLLKDFRVVYAPGLHYHVRMRANSITNRHKDTFEKWKKWIQEHGD
ncbi:MAG: glycosyltransferase family 2 protein [Novibacillus thermophilus]|jgi:hypothetical protein